MHGLAKRLAATQEVHVLAPHTALAARRENLDGVHVHRFRYLPEGMQRLAYDGGIVPKLKQNKWLALQIPFLFFVMLMQSIRLARQLRVDAIHAHWLLPQGLIALLTKRCMRLDPMVLTTSHGADLYSLNTPLLKCLKHYVLQQSDRVSVVSKAMQNFCQSEFKLSRPIQVAPMGIDCHAEFKSIVPFQERRGLVYVGRLVEKKGVHLLLQAFFGLLEHYPEQSLVVVGDGQERRSLELLAQQLNIASKVEFVGAVPPSKVPSYLNAAKISVMPSMIAEDGDQEGLGLVAAESIACGCITVVSNLDPIQDVHNEKLLQFSAGDAQALCARLRYTVENESEALAISERLVKRVEAQLDWNVVTKHYENLLQLA